VADQRSFGKEKHLVKEFYQIGMWLSIAFSVFLLFTVAYAIRDGAMPYRGALLLSISSLAVAVYSYRQQKE
jgi:hypothetical protein